MVEISQRSVLIQLFIDSMASLAAPVRSLASRLQLSLAEGRDGAQQRHNYGESSVNNKPAEHPSAGAV